MYNVPNNPCGLTYNDRGGVVSRVVLHLPPSPQRVRRKVITKEILLPQAESTDVSDGKDGLERERQREEERQREKEHESMIIHMIVCVCAAYLFGEDILGVDESFFLCYEVSPQRGSCGVQGQIIPLLVTVAHKRTKPIV